MPPLPHKVTKIVFEKDEDNWWTAYFKEVPLASGFGSSIGNAVYRLTQKIRYVTGETFIYHPATVVYTFDHWPPVKFEETWVVSSRGLGRVRNCFKEDKGRA